MKMKNLVLFLFCVCYLEQANAQSSFQISFDTPPYITLTKLYVNQNNEFSGIFQNKNSGEIIFGDFDYSTKKFKGKSLNVPQLNLVFPSHAFPIEKDENSTFMALSGHIFGIKPLNNLWVRKTIISSNGYYITQANDHIVFFGDDKNRSTRFEGVLNFWGIDKTSGNTSYRTGWRITKPDQSILNINYPRIIDFQHKKSKYTIGGIFSSNETYLIKADSTLFPEKGIFIAPDSLAYITTESSPDGSTYILFISRKKHDFAEYYPQQNKGHLLVVKVDDSLNIEWSKVYHGEKMYHWRSNISFLPNGEPILAYSTFGAFPTILAHLDKDGNIIKESGYPLWTPDVTIANDGSLLMETTRHFDAFGNTFAKNILAKTDLNGNIDGCENYPAHLKSNDIEIKIGTLNIDTFSIPDLDWATATMEPYEFTFSDFCDLPPTPNPNFTSIDTLCINQCLQTDSTLGNRNAQATEWTLEGKNMQPFISDSIEFEYCFDTPGTYTLRQTIWFLGVDYSFEKIIEVLPPLEINIQPDSVLCKLNTPLNIESNRPIQNIKWNTGETEPIIYASDSDVYSVTADDGYCYAGDTTFLEFIFEKIDTNFAIQLPDSVTACKVHLPFKLKPTSDYSTIFSNENAMLDSVFLLSKSDEYFFSTEVFGCRFSKKIDFKTDACKAEIFTPSAFSPNNDGINDEFIPLGKNIEPIRLEIYDRWGGKVFVSNDSQVAWDGGFDGKTVSKGVYVFRFEYVNLLTGLPEEISGDVSVF